MVGQKRPARGVERRGQHNRGAGGAGVEGVSVCVCVGGGAGMKVCGGEGGQAWRRCVWAGGSRVDPWCSGSCRPLNPEP